MRYERYVDTSDVDLGLPLFAEKDGPSDFCPRSVRNRKERLGILQMDDSKTSLKTIRARIDAVDRELLDLVNERAGLAQSVARFKAGEAGPADSYRPDREAAVLRGIVEANRGPLSNEEIVGLFREVMSTCRALQKRMNVAFLGPEGTFTEAAALKHFGCSVRTVPVDTIDNVFLAVEAQSSDYGVVPVENSTEGVVTHTLDRFSHSSLKICGEVQLRIHQHLMGRVSELGEVTRLYSHQQSLAQCRKWLNKQLPAVECVAVSSNAEAARIASKEVGTVAIAGDVAASRYELNILASNIEDEPRNTTRFLVIGHRSVPPTGRDKTSLLLSARNKPGALYDLLEPLARRRVSMTRIESRPSRSGLWEYVFFVDVEGHAEDTNLVEALDEIRDNASLCKVLGSYPHSAL